MDTIYFKTASGASSQSFDAILEKVFFEAAATEFNDLSWNKNKIVHAGWKGFIYRFGLLTTAQMDYLAALAIYDEPQYSTNDSTFYDMNIQDIQPGRVGGYIRFTNTAKET